MCRLTLALSVIDSVERLCYDGYGDSMKHFHYEAFVENFSMLHDQLLTDAAYDSGILRLTFGEYEIFREDYADDKYYERYKDYHECAVEIAVHTFPVPDMNDPTLCILKGERFKCMEMDYDTLVDFLRLLRAQFTFATIANNDELELQLLSFGANGLKRRYRNSEYRLCVFADAINFIWK